MSTAMSPVIYTVGHSNHSMERFVVLLAERMVEEKLDPAHFDRACLLCSEPTPEQCHRRLVLEYLDERWGGRLRVEHL